MKQKTIVLIILIFVATASSFGVLASDGYLSKKEEESKVLATAQQALPASVVLAKENTGAPKPTVTKQATTVKKAPVKKAVVKKKPVVKKKKVNLNPPVFTPATAPYSAKKR